MFYLLSDSTFVLREILPSIGVSTVTEPFYYLEMMHLPHLWSSYALLWGSRNPPSWSARMISSSRSLLSQERVKTSRLVTTTGLSLVNDGRYSSSVTWSIVSSAWTVVSHSYSVFSKMIKAAARCGSWSKRIFPRSWNCWVSGASFTVTLRG